MDTPANLTNLQTKSKDPLCIEKHLESEEEIQRLTSLKNALINRKHLLDKQLLQLQSNSDPKVTSKFTIKS